MFPYLIHNVRLPLMIRQDRCRSRAEEIALSHIREHTDLVHVDALNPHKIDTARYLITIVAEAEPLELVSACFGYNSIYRP